MNRNVNAGEDGGYADPNDVEGSSVLWAFDPPDVGVTGRESGGVSALEDCDQDGDRDGDGKGASKE